MPDSLRHLLDPEDVAPAPPLKRLLESDDLPDAAKADFQAADLPAGVVSTLKGEQPAPAPKPSVGRTALEHGLAGLTFRFSDELGGVGSKLGDWLASKVHGLPSNPNAYTEGRDEVRQDLRTSARAHPWWAAGSELAGGLVMPGVGALKATTTLGRVGLGVATGAVAGGVGGLGGQESGQGKIATGSEMMSAVGFGALVGGSLGGVATPVAGKIVDKVGPKVAPLVQRLRDRVAQIRAERAARPVARALERAARTTEPAVAASVPPEAFAPPPEPAPPVPPGGPPPVSVEPAPAKPAPPPEAFAPPAEPAPAAPPAGPPSLSLEPPPARPALAPEAFAPPPEPAPTAPPAPEPLIIRDKKGRFLSLKDPRAKKLLAKQQATPSSPAPTEASAPLPSDGAVEPLPENEIDRLLHSVRRSAEDSAAAPGVRQDLARSLAHRSATNIPAEDRSTVEALRNVVSSVTKRGKIPNERHYPVEPDVAFRQYLNELPPSSGASAEQQTAALKALTVGRFRGGADVGELIYRARAAGVQDEAIMRAVGVIPPKAPTPKVPGSDEELRDLLRQSVERGGQ
jgi:hypothetical protein